MKDDWLYSGEGEPDPEVAELAETLSTLRYDGQPPEIPQRRSPWLAVGLALAASLLLVVGASLLFAPPPDEAVGWALEVAGACPDDDCLLEVDEWLEPDTEVAVEVADIGRVVVDPGSRVRLAATGEREHRLELARGRIEAVVVAPPRLFVVDTPAATAVDLGCAYVLEVDEAGAGQLQVTEGYVALEAEDYDVIVPAGASAITRPEGPGTPTFDDSELIERVGVWDTGTEAERAEALDDILASSDARDTLTLWNMLPRVAEADRARLVDRILELAPLTGTYDPAISRERLVDLDPESVEALYQRLVWRWL